MWTDESRCNAEVVTHVDGIQFQVGHKRSWREESSKADRAAVWYHHLLEAKQK